MGLYHLEHHWELWDPFFNKDFPWHLLLKYPLFLRKHTRQHTIQLLLPEAVVSVGLYKFKELVLFHLGSWTLCNWGMWGSCRKAATSSEVVLFQSLQGLTWEVSLRSSPKFPEWLYRHRLSGCHLHRCRQLRSESGPLPMKYSRELRKICVKYRIS